MAALSSALPPAVKQDLLRRVREQIGWSEYQRLVSALGEDGLLELVLAHVAAGPVASPREPDRPGVFQRCSGALSAIREWAWPTHKSLPNHSYRELSAERAANIATGIVTVIVSVVVLVSMGPTCPWWYYLGVLPLGFGIAVGANYGGYPYRDLTKLVVAHTGVAVLIVIGGAVLVAAGFVVYWVFVGVGNWFKWLGGHF
jgi:hypothetical protein